jgi:hypothetical protein
MALPCLSRISPSASTFHIVSIFSIFIRLSTIVARDGVLFVEISLGSYCLLHYFCLLAYWVIVRWQCPPFCDVSRTTLQFQVRENRIFDMDLKLSLVKKDSALYFF